MAVSWSRKGRRERLSDENLSKPFAGGCRKILKDNMTVTGFMAHIPGPPKEPKIMAQYPKIESIGSIGSSIFGHFGGPGTFLGVLIRYGRVPRMSWFLSVLNQELPDAWYGSKPPEYWVAVKELSLS